MTIATRGSRYAAAKCRNVGTQLEEGLSWLDTLLLVDLATTPPVTCCYTVKMLLYCYPLVKET